MEDGAQVIWPEDKALVIWIKDGVLVIWSEDGWDVWRSKVVEEVSWTEDGGSQLSWTEVDPKYKCH